MAKLLKILSKFLLAILVLWPNFLFAADYTITPPAKIIDPLSSPETANPVNNQASPPAQPALRSVLEKDQPLPPPTPITPTNPTPDTLELPPLPPQTTEPALPANTPPVLKSVEDQQPRVNQKIIKVPEFSKTLMFNDEDLKKYKLIYNAYQQRLQNNQLVDNSLGDRVGEILGQVSQTPTPAPNSIYLNSILFRSAGSAAAWINGRKYELGVAQNGVTLEDVTPTYAKIQLEAGAFGDINFDEWKEHFASVSDLGDDVSIKNLPPSQQGIKIDPAAKTIHFMLRPNQRLDIGQKAIREGKEISSPLLSVSDKGTNPVSPAAQEGPRMPAESADNPASPEPPNSMNSAAAAKDQTSMEKTADFKVSKDGHFYIPASLNQQIINFKVDTGATVTAISVQDAKRIGVDINKLDYKYDVKIANGTIIKAAETNIANFDIDEIKLKDVNVLVAKGDIAQPLLGMSLLSKLKRFSIEGDTLTLSQ